MFLVLLRHSCDDLPLRQFKTREAALDWIATAEWDRPEAERAALDSDASTPICFSIVEFFIAFQGTDAEMLVPRSIEAIRSFEDEAVKASK